VEKCAAGISIRVQQGKHASVDLDQFAIAADQAAESCVVSIGVDRPVIYREDDLTVSGKARNEKPQCAPIESKLIDGVTEVAVAGHRKHAALDRPRGVCRGGALQGPRG